MATYFLRPGHLHTTDRILSCSEESGLITSPAVADTANKGALRLRVSGTPSTSTTLDVKLQTGGNPTGYAIPNTIGQSRGSSIIWKPNTAASTLWRGYTSAPTLVSTSFPFTYSATHGIPSTPRVLADGSLGLLVPNGTTDHTFFHLTGAGVLTSSSIPEILSSSAYRSDFVVLPSGRLVAVLFTHGAYSNMVTYSSDDHGATWSYLGESTPGNVGATRNILCAEVVEDTVVALQAMQDGSDTTRVFISTDGGATFVEVGDSQTLTNPRTAVHNGRILISHQAAIGTYVNTLTPGGDIDGTALSVGAGNYGVHHCVVTREDGTIWVLSTQATGAGNLVGDMVVSLDGGATFADPTSGDAPFDLGVTGYATAGITDLGACCWEGGIVVVGRVISSTGSDNAIALMRFGEWANITETGCYNHTYIPIDYPDQLGYTRTAVGAGATVTNQGPLRIVSTGANNYDYRAPATVWNTTTGDGRTVRFRFRVNSGGSTTVNCSRLRLCITDGVNQQEVLLKFSSTAMRAYDGAGTIIGAQATLDLTEWCDLLVKLHHDYPSAGAGRVTIDYRLEGDLTYTNWMCYQNVPEVVGTTDNLYFGGNAAGAADWEIAYLGVMESTYAIVGYTNPDYLNGYSLSASGDVAVFRGLKLGGRNGGGVPGDEYTVGTTYSYGKEAIWQELRPSKQLRSEADAQVWTVTFDAGSGDLFKANLVALFGTNFRTAVFEMNATDSWGAPSVTENLNATLTSFTVGAGVRGTGYVGPTATPDWRPGQYKSDGDGHRFFLEVGSVSYEITDNDEDRIYCAGIDFSASSGTAYIYSDRMGSTLTFAQYRFVRLRLTSQTTADGHYRLGTAVFDRRFTPGQTYDHGFVDRVEPTVEVTTSDSGYRSSVRRGPRRHTLAVQWSPLDRLGSVSADTELRIRDFYNSLEGSHRPFVFWRDSSDQSTLMLCRLVGTYSAANVWGELSTAVTRIDQLVLEEEL